MIAWALISLAALGVAVVVWDARLVVRAHRAEREVRKLLAELALERTIRDISMSMGIPYLRASNMLSKALTDPVSQPLSRVGIAFRAPWWRRPWLRLLGWWENRRG